MTKTVILAMNCAADAQRSGRDKSGLWGGEGISLVLTC